MSYKFIKPEDITISDYAIGTVATNITEYELYMNGVNISYLSNSPLNRDPEIRMTITMLKGIYSSIYKRYIREKEEIESHEQ